MASGVPNNSHWRLFPRDTQGSILMDQSMPQERVSYAAELHFLKEITFEGEGSKSTRPTESTVSWA